MKTCPACTHENADGVSSCAGCGVSFGSSLDIEATRIANPDRKRMSAAGMIANRYRIVRELGSGGMGVVYLVQDTALKNRQVALKMIQSEYLTNPEVLGRFEDEVIICQDLVHASIVNVYDLKHWGEQRFFTMEYIAGRSLQEWIRLRKGRKPAFDFPEVFSVIDPLLEALAYAHRFTIHRDIKPGNIMVLGEFPQIEGIKVLDFGIARTLSASRFTMAYQELGTAYYMSPEQMVGQKEIDMRADLYSVGMLLYEMLTGEVAVGAIETLSQIYPQLPESVDRLITGLLQRDPDRRPPNAESVRKVLADVLEDFRNHEDGEHREATAHITGEKRRNKKAAEREPRKRLGALYGRAREAFEARHWMVIAVVAVLAVAAIVYVLQKPMPEKTAPLTQTTPAQAVQDQQPLQRQQEAPPSPQALQQEVPPSPPRALRQETTLPPTVPVEKLETTPAPPVAKTTVEEPPQQVLKQAPFPTMSFFLSCVYQPGGTGPFQALQNGSILSSGDHYKIYFKPDRDGYAYVYQVDSQGHIFRLFPMVRFGNQVLDNLNPVQEGELYTLPSPSKSFILDRNTGKERIHVVLSERINEDIESLDQKLSVAQSANKSRDISSAEEGLKRYLLKREIADIVEDRPVIPDWSTESEGVEAAATVIESIGERDMHVIEFDHK